jgi:hypothetical protein
VAVNPTMNCARADAHTLERHGGHVMAFVDDDLAVVADGFAHLAIAYEALNHRDVQRSRRARLTAADSPDLGGLDTQK